jgi:hypothetical protein
VHRLGRLGLLEELVEPPLADTVQAVAANMPSSSFGRGPSRRLPSMAGSGSTQAIRRPMSGPSMAAKSASLFGRPTNHPLRPSATGLTTSDRNPSN